MAWIRSTKTLLVLALLVLLAGGGVLGASLVAQQNARGDLNMLRVANDNLELAMQARIDEEQGQDSLALTAADDEALAGHVEFLRELAPHTSGPGLAELLALDETLGTPGEEPAPMMGLSLALDSLARDTTGPVIDRLKAAQTRIWWSFWLTGLALAGLLIRALRRLGNDAD